MKTACLRCGDLVEEEAFPVRGAPLCAPCTEGHFEPTRLLDELPPATIVARRLWPHALAMSATVGGLILYRDALLTADAIESASNFALCGIVSLLFALVIFASPNLTWGNVAFARRVAADVGFVSEQPGLLLAILYAQRWTAPWIHVGLIVESEGGLVFLGWRGSRVRLPMESIAKVKLGRGIYAFPRQQIWLETRAGDWWRIELITSGSLRRSRAIARELATRIQSRLGPA